MSEKTEHIQLRSVEKGQTFTGVYYLEQAYVKVTVNGKKYTDITLRDKSGSVFAKFWGVLEGIKMGDFVDVAATGDNYQGDLSIIVRRIDKIEGEPENLADLISSLDIEVRERLLSEFNDCVNKVKDICEDEKDEEGNVVTEVKDKTCALLIEDIFGNEKFMEKFIVSPGSSRSHYGKIGGLLSSTLAIVGQAMQSSCGYGLSEHDANILLTASLISKIGAVDAYEISDCVPAETKRGTLVGEAGLTLMRFHSSMRRVSSNQKNKEYVSSDTLMRIFHAVLASGNLIKPSTKEALILSSTKRTDAIIVDALDFIDQDPNDDEFTAFDPVSKHRYYKGQVVESS